MSRRAAARARWISSARAVSAASGWASTGRLRSCARVRCSRCTQLRSACALRLRRSRDQRLLGGGVGYDAFGGVGRGGRPKVGDEVAQRVVGFMADGADHGGGARRDLAAQRLVGERQQVLDAAAAAGDDDHVDRGVGSSSRRASTIWGTAFGPCTTVLRTSNRTAGQRSRRRSSRHARPPRRGR